MKELIEQYIEHKSLSWSPSTVRSERYRLRRLIGHDVQDPRALFLKLRMEMKLYSLKTLFVRAGEFYQWLMDSGHVEGNQNVFKTFLKENAGAFKGVYAKEKVSVTFKEAREAIHGISDAEVRARALRLLTTGMRYSEADTEESGYIRGKGSKERRLFGNHQGGDAAAFSKSYSTFRRYLKDVGLKPHTLRKLFASELVHNGVDVSDLQTIMGWSSMQTASSYLQPRKDSELDKVVGGIVDEK